MSCISINIDPLGAAMGGINTPWRAASTAIVRMQKRAWFVMLHHEMHVCAASTSTCGRIEHAYVRICVYSTHILLVRFSWMWPIVGTHTHTHTLSLTHTRTHTRTPTHTHTHTCTHTNIHTHARTHADILWVFKCIFGGVHVAIWIRMTACFQN